MAEPNSCAPPAVARVKIVCAELTLFGIVIEVPLNAQVVDRLKAHPRSDGGKVSRFGEEGYSAHVERSVEYVTATGNQRSTETGIDEDILSDGPACPLPRTARADGGVFCSAGLAVSRSQIEPLGQRETGLVDIGCYVCGVHKEHATSLGPDSSYEAIGQLRLNHVAQNAVPSG